MSNLFTERVLNMAAVTPQPEDYTGEDGLLWTACKIRWTPPMPGFMTAFWKCAPLSFLQGRTSAVKRRKPS